MHYIAHTPPLLVPSLSPVHNSLNPNRLKPRSWALGVTQKWHCNCAECLCQAPHARSWTGESCNTKRSVFRYHTANPIYPSETLDRTLIWNTDLKAWKDFRQECSKPETLCWAPGLVYTGQATKWPSWLTRVRNWAANLHRWAPSETNTHAKPGRTRS